MKKTLNKNYIAFVATLKAKIRSARLNAVYTVNTQLLQIYWEIGRALAEQERQRGWGKKTVESLSRDLMAEFPDMKGLSVRNLRYMRNFALAYPHFSILQAPLAKLKKGEPKQTTPSILQAPLAKLSWYHHITLLDKVKNAREREFYIWQTANNGWSRNVMVHQIEGGLYKRNGKSITNFINTLPATQSELVQQVLKDPYKFEFIYLSEEARERDLEDEIARQITKVLLELGQWFAFMGKQYKITLGNKDYSFDLLFYHTRLKRYIIIDLKIEEFKPEHAGKMSFYLSLADEHLKSAGDEPSIGLILCKTKDGLVAEYTLRDMKRPIGISEYRISEKLPANIRSELPSVKEIECRIDEELGELKLPSQKNLRRIKSAVGKHKRGRKR